MLSVTMCLVVGDTVDHVAGGGWEVTRTHVHTLIQAVMTLMDVQQTLLPGMQPSPLTTLLALLIQLIGKFCHNLGGSGHNNIWCKHHFCWAHYFSEWISISYLDLEEKQLKCCQRRS